MPSAEQLQWYERALQWAETARALLGRDGFSREAGVYVSNLRRLADKLRSGRPLVAVFGQFSSGKTAVVNQLLGDRILPENLDETTAIHTLVEFDEAGSRLQIPVGSGWSDADEAIREAFFRITPSKVKESPLLAHMLQQRLWVRYLTDRLDPRVRQTAFLDTPGLGSRTMRQELASVAEALEKQASLSARALQKLAASTQDPDTFAEAQWDWLQAEVAFLEALSRQAPSILHADLVVWVSDIQQGLKRKDVQLLGAIQRIRPVVVLLNKADLLAAYDEDQQVRAATRFMKRAGVEPAAVLAHSAKKDRYVPQLLEVLGQVLAQAERRWARSFSTYLGGMYGLLLSLWTARAEVSEETQIETRKLLQDLDLSGRVHTHVHLVRTYVQATESRTRLRSRIYDDRREWVRDAYKATTRLSFSMLRKLLSLAALNMAHAAALPAMELGRRARREMLQADFWERVPDLARRYEHIVRKVLPLLLDPDLQLADALVGQWERLVEKGKLLGTYVEDED